jgi:hypothetical protein
VRGAILIAAFVLASQAGCAMASDRSAPPCAGHDLRGTFKAVPGSPGAGNISYALRLRNASAATCFVTGIPELQLLGVHGQKAPTHVAPAHPAALAAVIVRLAPGTTAIATARFSPDVPGKGEQHPGRCEAIADTVRVTPSGGGSLNAPITPPTSVCEHGTMSFSVLTAAR